MSQLRFITQTLYTLTQNYGKPIVLIKISSVGVDFDTGKKSVNKVEYKINGAICLESNVHKVILDSLITQDQKYSGRVSADRKIVILDKYKLPRGTKLTLQDQLSVAGRLYSIEKIFEVDFRRAYAITLSQVVGEPISVAAYDTLTLEDGASNGGS